ncbi:MAG TPA: hypothetical protein VFA60_07695 [Terriglobales bacterium]|nr:hypothetical protein [Terriglobales bacterium]
MTASQLLPPIPWKKAAVLLVDGNSQRQSGRAAGMRRCGLVVDCARDGVSAYALWQPKMYQLILIDMLGADDLVTAFYRYVQEQSPGQRIGFYRATRPFIVRKHEPQPEEHAPVRETPEHLQSALASAARDRAADGSLREAAQRIAALGPRLRARARSKNQDLDAAHIRLARLWETK